MKIRKLWRNKNQAVYDLSSAPRFPMSTEWGQ
jgi:hypothetical protein